MTQQNDDKSLHIADLIAKFMRGELSIEETEELDAWISTDPKNKEFFEGINDPELQKKDFAYFESKALNNGWEKISIKIEDNKRTRTYKWWAIAATLLFAISIAGWWFIERKNNNISKGVTTKITGPEIYPGSYTAILVDGKGISHTLLQNDQDTIENYAINTTGGLTYYHESKITDSNTLTVPVKGMFHVILEDGTQVWLHPSSVLKYPVCFNGSERRVDLVGGAYFKVAKNKSMPFRVYCRGVMTEAVGTEFNINGYKDIVTTSLVEGVVNVTTSKGAKTLTAGNSLRTSAETAPEHTEQLDTSLADGWKNGDFMFSKTKLTEVMTILSRWYGVELSFSEGYNWEAKTFNGKLPRNVPLTEVLEILSMTEIAQFKIQNSTIYITPK